MGKAKVENILKEINDDLNKYFSFIYPGYKDNLDKERKPYLKHIDSLSEFYFYTNYLLDKYKNFFATIPSNAFSLFYSKIASDVISVRQCLLLGQLLSAVSIERNIFETYVDTKLILAANTEERLNLFADYEYVQIWLKTNEYQKFIDQLENKENRNQKEEETLNSVKEHLAGLLGNEQLPQVLENYERVKENYHPKFPFHWAYKIFKDERNGRNPSLSSICKSLGIYHDYLQVYVTNSFAVHNSPLMRNFLDRGHGISSIPNFNRNIIAIAGITLNFAEEVTFMILKHINFPDFEKSKLYLENLYARTFID